METTCVGKGRRKRTYILTGLYETGTDLLRLCPEERLWLAVLVESLYDAFSVAPKDPKKADFLEEREYRWEARRWLMSRSTEDLSCYWVCENVGISHAEIRKVVGRLSNLPTEEASRLIAQAYTKTGMLKVTH